MKNFSKLFKNRLTLAPLFFLLIFTILLFAPFIFKGKLPIPADTVVGMYQPWRDANSVVYPSGIPYKNFLITDPVRQQIPWRQISLELLKNNKLPLWNPYNFSGTPLLANIQSAPLYPLNLIYFFTDFQTGWSFQILLQVLLGGLFLVFLLKKYKLHPLAISLGVISWVGSGFFVAWLEWNTLTQTIIWLPLILLCLENIFSPGRKLLWMFIFVISLTSAFLAGHLQTIFYVSLVSAFYFLALFIGIRNIKPLFFVFAAVGVSILLTLPNWIEIFKFISVSARGLDVVNWQTSSWFLPPKHLAQLFAPDFFGNPATQNYFGDWNYGEFVSYIGIIPLIFVAHALISKKSWQIIFFILTALFALIFALPTPIAKIPYILNLPFISTSQPSRLISVLDFSLVILSAFGLDQFLKLDNKKKLVLSLVSVSFPLILFLVTALVFKFNVSLRNLIFPLVLLISSSFLLLISLRYKRLKLFIVVLLVSLSLFDVYRFAGKFESFSDPKFLYPQTKLTEFLITNTSEDHYRVAMENDSIMPPNFNLPYKIQTISGYDPLYLKDYGALIYTMQGNKPYREGSAFGFNRILIPNNYQSPIFDLLGVKYFLTTKEIESPKLSKVFSEGSTLVYENKSVLPRAFFVENVIGENDKQRTLEYLLSGDFNARTTAIIPNFADKKYSNGNVVFKKYSENEIILETANPKTGFLILTDAFYPQWKVLINNKPAPVYLTDYIFRGVEIPPGQNEVKFIIGL